MSGKAEVTGVLNLLLLLLSTLAATAAGISRLPLPSLLPALVPGEVQGAEGELLHIMGVGYVWVSGLCMGGDHIHMRQCCGVGRVLPVL